MTAPLIPGAGAGTGAGAGVSAGDELTLEDVLTANAADEILLTDRGNGRRFAETYRHMVRYVVDRERWIVRSGPHWALDESGLATFALTAGIIRGIRLDALGAGVDDDARDAILDYARKLEAEPARLRMISSAREHPEITVMEDDLDAELDAVATRNGIVDLRTGELRPARADDLCTRVITVDYDPDARSPLLDQYLTTFMPDPDDQEVLFGVLGTVLRGGNPGRLLPFFLGGTTSGKSQLIAALARLLGDYACSINVSVFRGNLDDKPRPDLVRAMHHRVAYAVEASKIWELHADQVKRITGGDSVPYRDLYAGSVECVPRFTPLIITNEMPRIKGSDQALRRRVLTVRFDRTVPPQLEDTRIKERFIHDEGCRRALLARVVAGARCEALRDGVRWSLLPERYATATMESFGQLDHVDEFIEWLRDREILEVVDPQTPVSHCARANELHEWYGLWVKKHGNKQDKTEALGMKELSASLRDRGWTSRVSGGTRWVGVRLNQTVGLWTT